MHTISIFQAQVRHLAKHIEAEPKKHNAYKKNVYTSKMVFSSVRTINEHAKLFGRIQRITATKLYH